MSLAPPIFLIEGRDVTVFGSLDELITYVEPVDAMQADLRVFDSLGRRVGLRGEGVTFTRFSVAGGRTVAEPSVPAVFEPDVLASALRGYIGAVGAGRYGVTGEWLAVASLADLVGCVLRVDGYSA